MTDANTQPANDEHAPEDVSLEQLAVERDNLQRELTALKDQALRAMAEAENVRKRVEREKEDAIKYAVTSFARDLLGVADNMARALAHKPEDPALAGFVVGVEMTDAELHKVFNKHGITKVGSVGEKFDHNLHQAMVEIPSTNVEPGCIAQVMQEGFSLHGRLLRPALVGIARNIEPSSVDTQA